MATATPIQKAGTDKDGRILKNKPLTPRQVKAVKHIAQQEKGSTPSLLAKDTKVFKADEWYSTDKARRVLKQLVARGVVSERKDGTFSLTAKGKRVAAK